MSGADHLDRIDQDPSDRIGQFKLRVSVIGRVFDRTAAGLVFLRLPKRLSRLEHLSVFHAAVYDFDLIGIGFPGHMSLKNQRGKHRLVIIGRFVVSEDHRTSDFMD